MKNSRRAEAVREALMRLERYPTLSPFCKAFYRLICERLSEPEPASEKLQQAFHLFLRCECRTHQAVGSIMQGGKVDLLQIVRAGREAHGLLAQLAQALEHMELPGLQENLVRELILAECHYHLGRTAEVVRELRRALQMGCEHPLVHFALGYNLYAGAVQRFARAGAPQGKIAVQDPAAFRAACRDAITAFEHGIGDEAYDAQIYWWMGMIREMLGERAAACDAFRRAMEADPENFTEQTLEKLHHLEGANAPGRSPEEIERLARLAPITDADIRNARAMLDSCDSFPSTFLDGTDS